MYILALDQGTTGTTAALIKSDDLSFVGKVNEEFEQIFPKASWVEHNLNDIWATVEYTVSEVLKKYNATPDQISAIGITNQRETTCAFNKDGAPLANAIVWQDRRTEDFCNSLNERGLEDSIKTKTGLPIDAYFSATKMNWLLNNNEEVKTALNNNNLLFGNVDTFLLYKLSGGNSHKTDVSNASRTQLMNLDSLDWDDSLLETYEVPKSTLPSIEDSIGVFGETKGLSILPDGIKISGILGDQQAALFGQACFNEGEAKSTYGTGAFLLMNTGNKKQYSKNGLLTTVAYKHGDKVCYALEGSCYIAGACVQWLRDNLNFFESSPEIEEQANKVTELERIKDILLLPFFTGLGSPYWISNAKAAIVGLSRDSGKPEISRGALEGIALSINDVINSMRKDSGLDISELKVDGGAVANNLLMNIQASFSKVNVIRPQVIETTAYGAALAAAIGAGICEFSDLANLWKEDRKFEYSNVNGEYFDAKSALWSDLIKRLFT